ncbi:CAP-specific mRNA (nucleoside-2'-O-)-methyltransferase 1 [Elysia marginata]|uniref:Cap-specific mRNA (nucleoside-2'-O-)-methyltransferase 2 n=1 Tax=Elysia marginata TaxID=1093978 RepID=A0AAV4H029_9GAST|nr:CAP-specific mRNA (nucleoside-2'-O-)-methyltransferase 1 [Elysia marginata]
MAAKPARREKKKGQASCGHKIGANNKLILQGFASFLISPPAIDLSERRQEFSPSTAQSAKWAKIEKTLAAAKGRLDPYAHDKGLAEALRAVDLYAGLKSTIRRHYGGQAVTNAWLKMYEITSEMGLVTAARTPADVGLGHTYALRAFCNAELPGAFICALNHYLCVWHPETRFEWVGSSLYPSSKDGSLSTDRILDGASSDILGDHYGLYAQNPDRWLMSPEMRGDVTNTANIRALVAGAHARLGEVDLYTSDAGIEVSNDYVRQEELTARIHLGQTVVGLMSLRVGGVMVVKTYTFVHPSSLSLMAVCASAFDSFYVTKPVTSRPANSEVYIIGFGFRGLSSDFKEHLLAAVETFDFSRVLVSLEAPEAEATVSSLFTAAQQLHACQQVAFLSEAIAFYEAYRGKMSSLRAFLLPIARKVQAAWLKRNPVLQVSSSCLVVDDDVMKRWAKKEVDTAGGAPCADGPQ